MLNFTKSPMSPVYRFCMASDHRADAALADKLTGRPCRGRQRFGPLPQAKAQCVGECWILENRDLMGMQVARHPLGIADPRQRAGDYHPVVTLQDTRNLI